MTRAAESGRPSALPQGDYVAAGPSSIVDGPYAIKREIARGAMGVVLVATYQTLRTSVALETLSPRRTSGRWGIRA